MSSNSINQVKIKKLDGTYDARNLGVNYDDVDGLSDIVPVPTVYDSNKFLKGDGTWGKVSKGVSYGTSPTAADVASKVVTSAEGDFELEEGASINVKFTYGNTAGTPTLNIDTLGNKLIKAYGTEVPSLWWNAGDIVNFVYDGTNFIMRPTEGQINEINDEVKSKADFVNKKLSSVRPSTKLKTDLVTNNWSTKTWGGLTNIVAQGIWTDGENIYYSNGTAQRVLNKSTSTWNVKTWNGLTSFSGQYVWTDGENIYYSGGIDVNQYVLDKSTSTWTAKTWSGLTNVNGIDIWTDGDNIYYSSNATQRVFDKSTSTWNVKTWSGLTSFSGQYVWTDGENIYYSLTTSQYVLDKSTSTWTAKTWNGFTNIYGYYIWTDGDNIYYSNGSNQYVLDKSTSTWSAKTWNGLSNFSGQYVWTDGENTYCSASSTQYVLDKLDKPFELIDTRDAIAKINNSLSNKQDKLTNPLTQSDVVNNLTSTSTTAPLSAAQGKALDEGKQDKLTNPLTQSDVKNNLTSTDTNKPLSAAQGKALKDALGDASEASAVTGSTAFAKINQLNNDLIAYGQGHNGIYRGKDLGTVSSVASLESFLSSHKVSNGDFSDIYLGDIIHIQDGTYNAEWIVAGFNTHKNKGSNNVVSSNHIALIPKTILFSDKMNSTNTTEGGYKASYMHTTVMTTVTSKLNAVLGSHLLTRDILISNAISATTASGAYGDWTGASSSWEWLATRCELMSEVEVYGSKILSSSFFDIGEGCMKLPVFNFINHVHFARASFWLRGVAYSTRFCTAGSYGSVSADGASFSSGVRPLILIG